MDHVARELHRSLVAAYRPYLSAVAVSHDIGGAIAAGESWLSAALADLLGQPFVSQRKVPLQLFQEALRFPTAALRELGVPVPARSPDERERMPGDHYGLAPATTQDLGEEAWEAHIAWGSAKAVALTTVGWFGRDLTDRTKVESAAAALKRQLVVAPTDLGACGGVIVDLDHPDADAVLEKTSRGHWPTVAYGPHVDTERLAHASRMGAVALSRSSFFRDPGSHFPA